MALNLSSSEVDLKVFGDTKIMPPSEVVSPSRIKRRKINLLAPPEEKLAEDIQRHLGIYTNRSFHGDLTLGEKAEAGRRLESLLDAVADGALLPLMHFTLDKNQVQKLASLKDLSDHLSINDGDDFLSPSKEDEDFDYDPLADLNTEPVEAKAQTKKESRKKSNRKNAEGGQKKRKYFNCEHCDYQTPERGNLQRHVRTVHERERSFVCDECGHAASQKDGLKQHVKRIHEGERTRFACDQCDFTSRWKHTLAKHSDAAHRKIRDWECDACNYKSSMKAHIAVHMKRCHTESTDRLEKCQLCRFATASEKSLTEHLMSTHVNNHFLAG